MKKPVIGSTPIVDPFSLPSGEWELLLLPDGRQGASLLTSWQDASGKGRHASPTGAPALDGDGVLFTGSERLDGLLGGLDQPCWLFVVAAPSYASANGVEWFFEANAGDDDPPGQPVHTGTDTSIQVFQNYASVMGRAAQNPEGNAGYPHASTDLAVFRVDFTELDRVLYRDGKWLVANTLASQPPREMKAYRIGRRLDDTAGAHVKIVAVGVLSGAQSIEAVEYAQNVFLSRVGLPEPYSWPDGDATDTSGDPRLLLPQVTHATAGEPVTFWLDSFGLRDGYVERFFTSDLPVTLHADRVSVTPSAPGPFSFSVKEGQYSATTTILAAPPLSANAQVRRACILGDSTAARGSVGAFLRMKHVLGSRIEFVGTQGPVYGFPLKHEGYDGAKFRFFVGAQPLPGYTNPFDNGAVAWLAQIGGVLDFVFVTCGMNAVQGIPYEQVDEALDEDLALAEETFANVRTAAPAVKVIILTQYPHNMDPASGWLTSDGRYQAHRNVHRLAERILMQWGGREADGFHVAHTFPRIDPRRGYEDAVHPNASPGGAQIYAALMPVVASVW